MREVIMQVQSFSVDYPKASIYVGDLVRCKDCRHWYRKMNKCNRCPSISGNWGANDFCSYSERREREMKCYECKWLDRSVILTSIPPQYGCTLGFGSHYADHECEYDFMPIVRCKDCKYGQYDATHYFCAEYNHKVYEDDFCSSGERRE